jgi:hypothetical protein
MRPTRDKQFGSVFSELPVRAIYAYFAYRYSVLWFQCTETMKRKGTNGRKEGRNT